MGATDPLILSRIWGLDYPSQKKVPIITLENPFITMKNSNFGRVGLFYVTLTRKTSYLPVARFSKRKIRHDYRRLALLNRQW